MFTWTLAHGGMTHLLSNFVVILLAGPLLEDRFGSFRMLAVLVTASVLVGLAHCILDPGDALIGASGTVFCLIMLTAMLAGRLGTIPLTMLLVAARYLGRELVGLFANDGISQTAHIIAPSRGRAAATSHHDPLSSRHSEASRRNLIPCRALSPITASPPTPV
jgi:membrane associated rhomboid family serine protease